MLLMGRQPIAVSDISIYICLIDIRSKSKEQLNERRAGLFRIVEPGRDDRWPARQSSMWTGAPPWSSDDDYDDDQDNDDDDDDGYDGDQDDDHDDHDDVDQPL